MKNSRYYKPAIILTVIVLGVILVNHGFLNYILGPYALLPPPRPGTGAVIGRLELGSPDNSAYSARDLYLARVISSNQSDVAPLIAFDYNSDPRTVIHNSEGSFAFTNIAPGKYALLLWTITFSYVVEKPEGSLVIVIVDPDKTTDLGILSIP